jgi:murein DD-endopeptidase MepM/ murein hydrolase activator NlpD
LGLLLICGAVQAENIYKFQDENGIWHFTDRLPDDQKEFKTVYMEREPEPRITMRRDGPDSSPVYTLFNKFWGPAEVELSLAEQDNVLTEPRLPARFVLPAQSERALLGVGAMDERRGFSFRLSMAWTPGPPTPELVKGLVIHPPFASPEIYPISQGFNGGKTHTTPDSIYAIDIVMPIGTQILAVRAGKVMDVEEDFKRGGTNRAELADKANHVRILHEDGTMAVYAHLDMASVSVRPGQNIRTGQKIARSGNTGFSSGPHLHFVIQQNRGMELVSVPFQFRTATGETATPRANQALEGTLAGR